MKKKIFLFLGVACSIGFYSCTKKSITEEALVDQTGEQVESSARGRSSDCGCEPGSGSNIFDINCLVAASSHGKLDTIQKGFGFTEGPAVDEDGNVFFTDQPNDKIYKWKASNGHITTFLTGTGRSNGMAFDKKGFLIACADMHGELWKIAPNGSHVVLAKGYNGKLLNGPNDVWINPKTGGLYITDPIFPRGYWDANDPRKTGNPSWPPVHSEQAATGKGGHVYYLAPGSNKLVRVTTQAGWNADIWPNGVTGTPDGKKLYVNEWTGDATGTIWVFDINSNGTLSNRKVFVDNLTGCDGMSMDERGNVYVSHAAGVTAFDKKGKKVFNVPVGNGSASNNVFAGKDNKLLFITGTVDRVTSLKMNVEGVEKFDDKDDHDHGHGHGHN
ncbi:MAG: SMP-30/gluconolactonase/LRE family protein [Chitinophagaceae bacterium]